MREFMPVIVNIGRSYGYHRHWVQWTPTGVLLNSHVARLSLNISNYDHKFVLSTGLKKNFLLHR